MQYTGSAWLDENTTTFVQSGRFGRDSEVGREEPWAFVEVIYS